MYPRLNGYTKLHNEDEELPSYSSSLTTKSTRRKDKKYTYTIDDDDNDLFENASAPLSTYTSPPLSTSETYTSPPPLNPTPLRQSPTVSLPLRSTRNVVSGRCKRCGINGYRYYLPNLDECWCYNCSTIIKEKIEIPVLCETCKLTSPSIRCRDNDTGVVWFICYNCKNKDPTLRNIQVKKDSRGEKCIVM